MLNSFVRRLTFTCTQDEMKTLMFVKGILKTQYRVAFCIFKSVFKCFVLYLLENHKLINETSTGILNIAIKGSEKTL